MNDSTIITGAASAHYQASRTELVAGRAARVWARSADIVSAQETPRIAAGAGADPPQSREPRGQLSPFAGSAIRKRSRWIRLSRSVVGKRRDKPAWRRRWKSSALKG